MCLDVSTSRHKNLILSFSLTPKLRQVMCDVSYYKPLKLQHECRALQRTQVQMTKPPQEHRHAAAHPVATANTRLDSARARTKAEEEANFPLLVQEGTATAAKPATTARPEETATASQLVTTARPVPRLPGRHGEDGGSAAKHEHHPAVQATGNRVM